MYMDEFKNGANTLNVGTSAEDLLLELDASCEPAVEVYLNVIYAILSLLASSSVYAYRFYIVHSIFFNDTCGR